MKLTDLWLICLGLGREEVQAPVRGNRSGPSTHPGMAHPGLSLCTGGGGERAAGSGSLVTALLLFGSSIENGSGSKRACVQGRKYTNEEGAKETTFQPSLGSGWGSRGRMQ